MAWKIINTDNGKEFVFILAQEVGDNQQETTTQINFPSQPASSSILLSLNGQTEDVRLSFKLYNNGEDQSNGTHSSSVVTLGEQKVYLKKEINQSNILPVFELETHRGETYTGKIEQLEFNEVQGRPNEIDGTMRFLIGGGS